MSGGTLIASKIIVQVDEIATRDHFGGVVVQRGLVSSKLTIYGQRIDCRGGSAILVSIS